MQHDVPGVQRVHTEEQNATGRIGKQVPRLMRYTARRGALSAFTAKARSELEKEGWCGTASGSTRVAGVLQGPGFKLPGGGASPSRHDDKPAAAAGLVVVDGHPPGGPAGDPEMLRAVIELGLGRFLPLLSREEFDLPTLRLATPHDLHAAGLPMGPATKLLSALGSRPRPGRGGATKPRPGPRLMAIT